MKTEILFMMGVTTILIPLFASAEPNVVEIRSISHESRSISHESRSYSGETRRFKASNFDLKIQDYGLKKDVKSLNKAIERLQAKVTEKKIVIDLSADVLFGFDQFDLKPEAHQALEQVLVIIHSKTVGNIQIAGHTDAKGNNDYNQLLSEQRADSVKSWLVERQIEAKLIKTIGYGESQPVAANQHKDGSDNPDGRHKNRRVNIIINTVETQ